MDVAGTTDLLGPRLLLDLLMDWSCVVFLAAELGRLVGRAGVGMLFSTVAMPVKVLAVTGGRGVLENGSGRMVVTGDKGLLSWGEREESLARFILFIS